MTLSYLENRPTILEWVLHAASFATSCLATSRASERCGTQTTLWRQSLRFSSRDNARGSIEKSISLRKIDERIEDKENEIKI